MATTTRLTVDSIPKRVPLPDGSGDLLAEADAFRLVESDRHLIHAGGLIAPAKLQLIRRKEDGHMKYELAVSNGGDATAGGPMTLHLGSHTSLEPSKLSGLRVAKHVVKPKGESVLKAVANSDGDYADVVVIQVHEKAPGALGAIGGGATVAVAFQDQAEAKGWFVYLSSCLGILDEAEGGTFEALCAKSAAGHEAHVLSDLHGAVA